MGVGADVGNPVGNADGLSVGQAPQKPSSNPCCTNSIGKHTSKPLVSKQKSTPFSYSSSSGTHPITGSQPARGSSEGDTLGLKVGSPVGFGVGTPVGIAEGKFVGATVGLLVGISVGEAEGLRLGHSPQNPYSPPSASCTYSTCRQLQVLC